MQRPLFLTGMMGCGKTTVGRILADDLGVALVDLDTRVEHLFGRTVPELFAEGEQEFRAREQQALGSLLAEPGFGGRPVVVATGGGAILDATGREAMDEIGTRVYLEVGVDELARRLRMARTQDEGARPLLEGPERLRLRVAELLATRRSRYRTAALCIDGLGEPSQVAARIVVALGEGLPARGSEAV